MERGRLRKKICIQGSIRLLTGLHIGGSSGSLEIGGVDNSIIRHPVTQEPYIPGSSLKGKLRSLLERIEGKFGDQGGGGDVRFGPYLKPDFPPTLLFGTTPEALSEAQQKGDQPPSRLIFRDAYLTDQSRKELGLMETDLPYTEVKTETSIDRITSAANPRQLERVPSGAEFEFSCILNVFEGDDEKQNLRWLWTAMMLLQDDYLGGSGSRGNGHVSIAIQHVQEKTAEDYKQLKKAWNLLDLGAVGVPTPLRRHPDNVGTTGGA